jgi:hypothetical protein
LAETRPDLVALYEERFRRGAYQPEANGARLQNLVKALVAASGGRSTDPGDTRDVLTGERATPPPTAPDLAAARARHPSVSGPPLVAGVPADPGPQPEQLHLL